MCSLSASNATFAANLRPYASGVTTSPVAAERRAASTTRSVRRPTWPSGVELVRERRYGETTLWCAEAASEKR